MKKYVGLTVFLLLFVACKTNYPGPMEKPQSEAEVTTIENINSTINIDNGIYDLEVYARGTEDSLLVVTAGKKSSSILLQENVWKTLYVRGIEITDGKVALSCKTLEAGATYEVKIAYLRKTGKHRNLIRGGDLSLLSQVENNGGKYFDNEGKEGDCFEICAKNGMNLVRLRLLNDPGNEANTPSNRMFKGIQDETNILSLAKRAKEAGMQIELTFHYSDYWTNGIEQYKPAAWENYSQEQLHNAMYSYTKNFLEKMVEQGTAPEFVSIGNEIQSGILFGTIEEKTIGEYANANTVSLPTEEINGYCDDMNNLASLLQQGCLAVREVCPDARIIIHLTTSTNITTETFKWFFNAMKNNNLDYDIIGASYYPYYGNKTIEEMIASANTLTQIYDKDFIFMETGFAWNPTLEDGSAGQIADNKPYENMTPEAQRWFIQQLTEQMNAANGRILGYIYWDPIYIAAPNCGWAVGEKNVTGNSTIFDFSGQMLPVWDALRYN